MKPLALSRRRFLSLSATLGAGVYAAPAFLRAQSPGKLMDVVYIGAAGKGTDNINEMLRVSKNKPELGINIVGLCDVDTGAIEKAKAQIEKVTGKAYEGKAWQDYRKMFDELKSYDAVVISSPDHHHFPATERALRAKKHVYCEKPLTHTIWEARRVKELAAKAGVATQMGNQGNASEDIRATTEWIKAGVIGNVLEAHAWSNRPIWPQGVVWPEKADKEIPKELDWDLWLGPAPERPYYSQCHPFKWRGFWDFGTGAFGDMGCHILNWPFTALDLDAPINAECISEEGATKDSPPRKSVIRLGFAAKGARPALNLFWHDGGNLPNDDLFGGSVEVREDKKRTENGALFIGEKGTLFDDYDKGGPTLLPRDSAKDFKAPEKTLKRSPGHHEEWLRACRGEGKAGSDIVAKSADLTEMVLIGHLAARIGPGKVLEWDAKAGRAKNAPEADQYIHKKYRKGWEPLA